VNVKWANTGRQARRQLNATLGAKEMVKTFLLIIGLLVAVALPEHAR